MKRGKKALIQDYTWDKSTRKEEWRKCNILVVHKGVCSKDVRGKLLPWGINQARDLVSSLDAHVIEYKTKRCVSHHRHMDLCDTLFPQFYEEVPIGTPPCYSIKSK